MIYYAGIGSRHTPLDIQAKMSKIARMLELFGYTLRSGGADGADLAFEQGTSVKEIWVPWTGFNNSSSDLTPTELHFDIAAKFHPRWDSLRLNVKKLHARNVGQVLGHDGSNPSKFVLCWTPDGCSNGSLTTKETGGTGQAIRIATGHGVPVINLNTLSWSDELAEMIICLKAV